MQMGDVHFAANPMLSRIRDDNIALTPEQHALPDLKGMGRVRDLQKAAATSEELAQILKTYAKADSKQSQLKLLDGLLTYWAKTDHLKKLEGFSARMEQISLSSAHRSSARQGIALTPSQYAELVKNRNNLPEAMSIDRWSDKDSLLTQLEKDFYDARYKVGILDSFTGQQSPTLYYATDEQAKHIIKVVNETYDKLHDNAYKALLFQTRLKPYVNAVGLTLDDNGELVLDFGGVADAFNAVHARNPEKAFVDLGEFIAYSQKDAPDVRQGMTILSALFLDYREQALAAGTLTPYIDILGQENYADLGSKTGTDNNDTLQGNNLSNALDGGAGNDVIHAGDGNDRIRGGAGDDYLNAGDGDDTLNGGTGNDVLHGGSGNDTLNGGIGNDHLDGSWGADTYHFAKGHGEDIVHDHSGGKEGEDSLRLADVNAANVRFSQQGYDLMLYGYHNTDSIQIKNFFNGNNYHIEQFHFADKNLSLADLKTQGMRFEGTAGNDTFAYWDGKVEVHAGDGNDTVRTAAHADVVEGGSGDDRLYTGDGDDVLDGGEGHDVLHGGSGNDTLNGGTGNDYLDGNWGADTYHFAKGHGEDTISDYGDAKDADTIRFADVALNEVRFREENQHLLLSGYHGEDSVRISHFFNSDNHKIERFEFADQALTLENIRERAQVQSASNQTQQMIAAMNAFAAEKPTDGKVPADTEPSVLAAAADAAVKASGANSGAGQAQQMVDAMAAFAPSANVSDTALPDPVQPPVLVATHP